MTAWTLPPGARCFPEYQALIVSPLTLVGGLRAAVGADQLAVDHDVRPALLGHLLQGLVQVGGLRGEHLDALVAVAVGRRARHPEPGTDDLDLALGAHPHQHQQRLAEAGQQAGSLTGAAGAALGAQQLGQLEDQFTGDIEHGTIGDQRGVLGRVGSCGRELPTAGPTSQPASARSSACRALILPILLRYCLPPALAAGPNQQDTGHDEHDGQDKQELADSRPIVNNDIHPVY